MDDKKVILSVAGAGKTYTICQKVDKEKRNIIIAFTKQNVKNIEIELLNRFNCIPKHTKIYTFHKFVYNFFIRPYENKISEFYKQKIKSKGLSFNEPPKLIDKTGKLNYKKYFKQNDIRHFVIDNRFYSTRISELIIYLDKNNSNIFEKAINQLSIFFENLYIDEFQDFRGYDYQLLEKIIKRWSKKVLLVGDYYQHSVSSVNNAGVPFQKSRKNKITNRKDIISYDEYIKLLQNLGLFVDTDTLIKSRRCSEEICQFISGKLKIRIESEKINKGEVYFIKEDEAEKLLNDNNIIKLVYKEPYIWNFNAISWSYSKGDTYKDAVVVLTRDFEKIDTNEFDISKMSPITINKLYVAMTRTSGNLYILKYSIFNRIKERFLIKNNHMF